jgi:EmrB/QacA subfamily drug resistance transporter
MFLSTLGISIANVGLPTMEQAFDVSFQEIQWIVIAYLLAITTLSVSVGRLGDIVGRRRLLLVGLALFAVASALCGLAPSLAVLIAARAVQGLGAAIMMALAIALVGDAVPKEKTGSAMGLLGTMSAVGTALGPSLGGVLIAAFGWQALFLVCAPLAALTFFVVHRSLPVDHKGAMSARTGFDTMGTMLLAATLAAYALAMTMGRGQFGALNVVLLIAAAVGIVAFVRVEARVASPVIQLAMLRERALSTGLVASALVSTVIMVTLVVGPFYLARALGFDAVFVGLFLAVGPVVVALAGIPAGRVVDRFGARRIAFTGLVGLALGSVLLATLPLSLGIAGYLAPVTILTAGYALFQTANNTGVMANVARERRGVVSGLLNLSRNLGLTTGASLMGAVFAFASQASAEPEAVAVGLRTTFAVGAVLIGVALVVALFSRGTRPTLALHQSK